MVVLDTVIDKSSWDVLTAGADDTIVVVETFSVDLTDIEGVSLPADEWASNDVVVVVAGVGVDVGTVCPELQPEHVPALQNCGLICVPRLEVQIHMYQLRCLLHMQSESTNPKSA